MNIKQATSLYKTSCAKCKLICRRERKKTAKKTASVVIKFDKTCTECTERVNASPNEYKRKLFSIESSWERDLKWNNKHQSTSMRQWTPFAIDVMRKHRLDIRFNVNVDFVETFWNSVTISVACVCVYMYGWHSGSSPFMRAILSQHAVHTLERRNCI